MSLSNISGPVTDGFIHRSLNTTMTRREFLQMGGALILAALGVQNLVTVFMKHIKTTSPVSLMSNDPDG